MLHIIIIIHKQSCVFTVKLNHRIVSSILWLNSILNSKLLCIIFFFSISVKKFATFLRPEKSYCTGGYTFTIVCSIKFCNIILNILL